MAKTKTSEDKGKLVFRHLADIKKKITEQEYSDLRQNIADDIDILYENVQEYVEEKIKNDIGKMIGLSSRSVMEEQKK